MVNLMRPPQKSIDAVLSWLRTADENVEIRLSAARDFAHCVLTVAQTESILPGAKYYKFEVKILLKFFSVLQS